MFRACVLHYGKDWDKCLSLAEFSYNNSYQSSLKMAPFEALYGRRCRTPLNWSQAGEREIFGPDLVLEAEAVGDRYPPGPLKSKRPHERPKGPINHKVILSWAWGETTSKADRREAGLVQTQTTHNVERATTTEIRLSRAGAPMQRSHARISRQNYREINSNSSLSFSYTLLSYPHVLPHGRIYKA